MDSTRTPKGAALGDTVVLTPIGATARSTEGEGHGRSRQRRQLDAWVLKGREEYSVGKEERTGVETGVLAGETSGSGGSADAGGHNASPM